MSIQATAATLSIPLGNAAGSSRAAESPCIVIATADAGICSELTGTLAAFSVNTVGARSLAYVKTLLAGGRVAACLCGPWLQDGTFRGLVRHIRRARIEMPVIIASAPAWSAECGALLGVMNIGTLGFLPHPYLKADLARLLNLAIGKSRIL